MHSTRLDTITEAIDTIRKLIHLQEERLLDFQKAVAALHSRINHVEEIVGFLDKTATEFAMRLERLEKNPSVSLPPESQWPLL